MDLAKKRKLEENGLDSNIKLSIEDARKIIEPFTQDQLLEIVQNAAVRYLDVLDAVRSIADRDPTQRKLFIRGLGWETTTENLRSLFATYGDLEEAIVIHDKATGKSKGYGFVTYKHIDGALLALKEPSKKIDGRMTVTQLASAGITGPSSANLPTNDVSARKIYVANVPYDMPGERLLAHFSSYGEVEEGPLGFDKTTGKSKGFALFVYKTPEAARASLVDPIKTIDGHQLNCKLAIDGKRGKPPPGGANQGQGGVKAESNLDGQGVNNNQPGSMPASFASQYGGSGGGPGGISPYGGFSGGSQGGHSHNPVYLNSQLDSGAGLSSFGGGGGSGAGLSSIGSQAAAASLGGGSGGFGSGLGSPYGGGGGSHFGGPGSNYGGLGGAGGGMAGGVGGGLGRVGSGLGGSGRGSMYGLPPNAAGGFQESAHYSLSSGSGYPGQHHQTTGSSPITRVPPGGMYQGGIPPYY